MTQEFGEPGVENPRVVDLVSPDPKSGAAVLLMIERRPWNGTQTQLRELEEKINRYLGYALDGFLVEHYPQYEGKSVRVQLDCVEEPHGEAAEFLRDARRVAEEEGIEFVVNVTQKHT